MAQAIRPFGRSTDFGGSGSAVRTANVTFPLTPALSLRERENSPLAFSKTQRGFCSTNFPGRGIYPAGTPALQIRVGEFQGPFATQPSCGLKSALRSLAQAQR